MESGDLAVRVARAIKASLDAEGVDFSTAAQDEALHFQRMRLADARLHRENPALIAEVREWYLATHPPLQEQAADEFGEFFDADSFYLMAFLAKQRPWWEILRESDGTQIDVPPAPEETNEPPAWPPQPWWDALDEQVRAALLVVQEREDVRPGQPDLYARSGRMLRRFASEYPQLAAALADRYAALDEKEISTADADVIGLGLWITENMAGEPFVPRRLA